MSSEQEQRSAASATDAREGVDRRGFLESAAWIGALAGVGAWDQAAAAPRGETVADDARLPDGSRFRRWDRPLTFSKTYYVDNTASNADDAGPGNATRPFRTIGKAAEILQPGERVIIAAGTYRECVRPARGGTSPARMISYEAAPGATVHITGSEVLKDGWQQETVTPGFPFPGSPAGPGVTVWRHDLTGALFPDAYNPFALPSIMGSWGWLDGATADLGPYLRRRGLVFVDGKPLEPMEQLRELAMPDLPPMPDFTRAAVPENGMPARRRGGPIMQEIGGAPTARFWADHAGTAVYVRLASGTPADHQIEVTTRQHAFIPARSGTGFIRVKGITFRHAGNAYPFPQYGMVSLAGGDHWILEGNTFEWANGIGLAIGSDGNSAGAPQPGTSIVVRGNTIRYCGVEGIGGMGTTDALIEDNLIEWCGWADAERGWEAAGAKFHRARNMLFRRNVIRHMRHANAAWWDVDNDNCRVTRNVVADVLTVSAAVHFEMTPARNMIDTNIVWDVRNAEPGTPGQRGCAGSGIFDNASSNLVIAQNLIGRCDNAGVFTIVRPDRRRPVADNNEVANNIFVACKSAMVFLSTNNRSDGNVYVDMPNDFLGILPEPQTVASAPDAWRRVRYSDLASWRSAYGWDRTSLAADARIAFDSATLTLTVSTTARLPRLRAPGGIETDIRGRATGPTRIAGPLADLRSGQSLVIDPRLNP
ncbi:right-handed parallel beta-helix repeat-containing protein [Sphingomonas sp. H39-1-10]|uniref:right-handed parallel beta-helix repeat-containing protein n=1 Tax=Sphingomonas pollutisoli TaxID=3030829 RepID=UPI0023B964EB|nr:right-handed parallel beta-helix repeat-containing protein [Sphingomonas pollutisoli]MDF0486530.1 right-handed parallel beta-helix repeat-containing protein [Sphingomonas pollutisoli]